MSSIDAKGHVEVPARRSFDLSSILGVPLVYPLTVILLLIALVERPAMLSLNFSFTIVWQAIPLMLIVIGQSLCLRIRSIDWPDPVGWSGFSLNA